MTKFGFASVFLFSVGMLLSQEIKQEISDDDSLKEAIYKDNRKAVLNYSIKEFDNLFFEFTRKKSDPSLILSKQEFYNYTVRIAIFSDRFATLYPKDKLMAAENKKQWLAQSYQDYIKTKIPPKK